MSKTTTRAKTVKSHWGRAREPDSSGEPFHVSDAPARIPDQNTSRKFDFSQREHGKLLERPSTSGGASVKSSMRKTAQKRETKDDLHFNPLAVHGKGTLFYDFPRPGTLPTPASSPKLSPPLIKKPTKPRSDTPESIPDADPKVTMNIHRQQPVDLGIGMALGSPAHPPTDWQTPSTSWQPQSQSHSTPRTFSPEHDMAMDGSSTLPNVVKPKGSRWKMLGGLFGAGRKNSEPQPFYQLQPEPAQQVTTESNAGNSVEQHGEKRPKPRGRTLTTSERKTERKPDMMRSKTLPANAQHNVTGANHAPEIKINGGHNLGNTDYGHSQGSQGLLNVDIPTIQMERYSIMFGSVLQKAPTTTAGSSALLARRQATLDKLKTVNEALALKERELEARAQLLRPRRATSPQPAKSPAFSLFPSTPSRLTVHDALPSPLQRSNTSPASLSPSCPSFSRTSEDHGMSANLSGPAPHIPHVIPRPKLAPSFRKKTDSKPDVKSASNAEQPKVEPIKAISKHQQQLSNTSEENSSTEFGSEDEYVYRAPLKPKLDEPVWRMVTPATSGYGTTTSISGGSSSSRSGGHSTSTSASSIVNSSPNISNSVTVHKQVEIQAVPANRRKRAATTTSAPRSLPRPAEVSNAAFGASSTSASVSTSPKHTPIENEGEREERLKSAADISIARQISVSRQQTQLLPAIKKSNSNSQKPKTQILIKKSLSVASNSSPHRANHNPNFSSPVSINMARSPLQVVSDPESPITGTPLMRPRMVTVKPSTPTLVVAGNDAEQCGKLWGGQTAANSPALLRKESVGEMYIGLKAGGSPIGDGGNRKSERVVLERVY